MLVTTTMSSLFCGTMLRSVRLYSTDLLNYYQILDLLPQASLKEIKLQFKKLLKLYHPDLNAHLSATDKESNSQRYVLMVLAYETLKDVKKKREYDATLRTTSSSSSERPDRAAWQDRYYGEARYYSRSKASGSHTSHGYNYTRHRVRTFYNGTRPKLGDQFAGQHRNHGDRYDVPHFDYNEHLSKHLKFEQRIINKHLSPEDRDNILRQLAKDGDISNVSEELITKHLMRQARRTSATPQTSAPSTERPSREYMYQGPHNDESSFGMRMAFLFGGAGSIYLLYQLTG